MGTVEGKQGVSVCGCVRVCVTTVYVQLYVS